jgi:DNA repair exonuclease SbcCD ATPase subunit
MKRIHKTIALAILTVPAFVACNQDKIDKLTSENQELATQTQTLNTELEDYLKTFNEIEANLREIKEREENISTKTSDVEYENKDQKDEIVSDIQMINTLMAENKKKISSLQDELSSTNSEFKKMVSNLNYRIKEKDEQITTLKTELETLNIEKEQLAKNVETLTSRIDTLSVEKEEQLAKIEEQQSRIEDQTEALNTAYVAIGSYKDLRDEEVVVKEGGVLGLGSTERLNDQINNEAFSKIDITEVQTIPVLAKKVELVSVHPLGSYEFQMNAEEKVEKLVILDPEKFWASSKYLVVMVE